MIASSTGISFLEVIAYQLLSDRVILKNRWAKPVGIKISKECGLLFLSYWTARRAKILLSD